MLNRGDVVCRDSCSSTVWVVTLINLIIARKNIKRYNGAHIIIIFIIITSIKTGARVSCFLIALVRIKYEQ